MQISQSIRIAVPPEDVFRLYEDIASWRVWDSEVAEVSLPEGLCPGSAGWLKPRTGPRASIEVVEVLPGCSFTVQSRLPFCRMVFEHKLALDGGQTIATHSVGFSGPLRFLFSRLIGQTIRATLPNTLHGLKTACERGLENGGGARK